MRWQHLLITGLLGSSSVVAQTVTNPVTYKRYVSIVRFSPIGASSVALVSNQAGLSNPHIASTLPYQKWAGADLRMQLTRYGVQTPDAKNIVVDANPEELNLFLPVHKRITVAGGINSYVDNNGRYNSSDAEGLWTLSSYGGLLQARLFAGLSLYDKSGWKVSVGGGAFFLTGVLVDTLLRRKSLDQTLRHVIISRQTVRDIGSHASILVSRNIKGLSVSLVAGINHNPKMKVTLEKSQWVAVKWQPSSITDTVLLNRVNTDTTLEGTSELFAGIGFAGEKFQFEVLGAMTSPIESYALRTALTWFLEPEKDLPVKKALSVAFLYQDGQLMMERFRDIGMEIAYIIPGVGTAGSLTLRVGLNRWQTTTMKATYWHVATTVALRERWFIRRKFE